VKRGAIKPQIIRCIVPEGAVADNHAELMMAFRPGQKETWAEVEEMARLGKAHKLYQPAPVKNDWVITSGSVDLASWSNVTVTTLPAVKIADEVADFGNGLPNPPAKLPDLVNAINADRYWNSVNKVVTSRPSRR